jgi:hypothetical protein
MKHGNGRGVPELEKITIRKTKKYGVLVQHSLFEEADRVKDDKEWRYEKEKNFHHRVRSEADRRFGEGQWNIDFHRPYVEELAMPELSSPHILVHFAARIEGVKAKEVIDV